MQENKDLQDEHIAPLEAEEHDNPFPMRGLIIILIAALVSFGFYKLLAVGCLIRKLSMPIRVRVWRCCCLLLLCG